MTRTRSKLVDPRKTPRQGRSVATVDAVLEATLQVLLAVGPQRLTTTRVAERAGVSVGTLYQYFPNKDGLLLAVLQRHFDRLVETVEDGCDRHRHLPLGIMAEGLARAYVAGKTARAEESRALYLVAAELNAAYLVRQAQRRMRTAISSMLATARDARFENLELVTHMLLSAMAGPTRAVLDGGAPPQMARALLAELATLCDAYLQRVALPLARPSAAG